MVYDLSNIKVKTWFMTLLQWLLMVLLSQNIEKLVFSTIQSVFNYITKVCNA
jgi:hypothetical protein